jgi:hypothetical protein
MLRLGFFAVLSPSVIVLSSRELSHHFELSNHILKPLEMCALLWLAEAHVQVSTGRLRKLVKVVLIRVSRGHLSRVLKKGCSSHLDRVELLRAPMAELLVHQRELGHFPRTHKLVDLCLVVLLLALLIHGVYVFGRYFKVLRQSHEVFWVVVVVRAGLAQNFLQLSPLQIVFVILIQLLSEAHIF